MDGSVPFPSFAHVGAPSGDGHQPPATIPGLDAEPLQPQFLIHSENLSTGRHKLKLTRAALATVVLLAFTAALVFLVIQCFRVLTSGRSTENHGVTSRRLARRRANACSVSYRVKRTGQAAARQVLRLPIAAFRRFGLSLGGSLRVSQDAQASSQ